MTHLGINIKKIRIAKKLSQSEFAALFNLSRAAIGSYEEGRAEAKIETLIQISDYFQISLDKLLKHKLTVNDILNFNDKKSKIERLSNKQSIIFVEFDKLKDFHQNTENKNVYKEILIPDFNSDYIAFEYFGKKTKEVECNFDNSILICKRKIISKDILYSDKFYFLIDRENYYLGKITFLEKSLKITKIDDEVVVIVFNNNLFLFEIASVIIKDFPGFISIENNDIVGKIKSIIF
jgi:transcriptional regulator with XRE-family HTH domain